MAFPPPSPPFPKTACHTSGHQALDPCKRIVIHSTVGPSKEGSRYGISDYFHSCSSGGSAHYVVDAGGVLQCVGDHTVAWHAPPNTDTLGIEMCDYPTLSLARFFNGGIPKGIRQLTSSSEVEDQREDLDPGPGVKRVNIHRLLSPTYRSLLDNTAKLTAELALAYDVPMVYVNAADLRAGKRGVTTHRQVSLAFGQSTHWDPGAWPRRYFMRRVRYYAETLRAAGN